MQASDGTTGYLSSIVFDCEIIACHFYSHFDHYALICRYLKVIILIYQRVTVLSTKWARGRVKGTNMKAYPIKGKED